MTERLHGTVVRVPMRGAPCPALSSWRQGGARSVIKHVESMSAPLPESKRLADLGAAIRVSGLEM